MTIPDPVSGPGAFPPGASELKLRVISALVLAIGILALTWAGGWPFLVAWAIVGGLVLFEWFRIIGRPGKHAGLFAAALVVLVLAGSVRADIFWIGLAGLCLAGAATVPEGLRRFAGAGVLYAAVICIVPPALRDRPEIGLTLIVWTFAVVWLTDIAAYFTGRALGGPKLAPRFSPKKTWSGAVGGTVVGTICGMLVWLLAGRQGIAPPYPMPVVFVVSLVASVLGQVGDIGESAFKRHFGVKDSGHLIPGHGGFMDRLDGYWAVLAFAGLLLTVASVEN